MARLWTDEQEATYRATPREGGRWSGGIYLSANEEPPKATVRKTLFQEVLRAVREISHE